jgi:hypothetical protein
VIAVVLALVLGIPPEGGSHTEEQMPPPRDTRAVATAPGAVIAGVVTTDDAQPRPLRRARVMVNGPSLPMTRTAITGDDGTFTIAVPAGAFDVSAEKEAYVPAAARADRPARATPVVVAAGETRRLVIRLSRGAVITGTVFDVDGQPAQGIAVAALSRRFHGLLGEMRYSQIPLPVLPTDDRGTYRIYGLPAGEYVVAAQPEQTGTSAASVRPIATMVRGAPGRRAMASAQVFFPSATDLDRAARVAVRAGEERSGVDVQLKYVPLSTVSGSAATSTGWSPAEVAMVRVGDEQEAASSRTTRADDAGRFSFVNVPAGQYRIGARSIGPLGEPSMAVADLTVDGEDADNLVLALQPALRISGLVAFHGDTPPPVFGKSTSTPPPLTLLLNGYVLPTPIQIDGLRFRIDGLVPGRFRMGSAPPGLRSAIGGWWLQSVVANGVELLDAPIELTQSVEDAVAVYSDRASDVSGRVTTADGVPVNDSMVVAFSTNKAAWFVGSRRVWGARTDRDGKYVIRNLPSGEYRLSAATGLQLFEWFDPARLDELLPGATPLTINGPEKKAVDLRVR